MKMCRLLLFMFLSTFLLGCNFQSIKEVSEDKVQTLFDIKGPNKSIKTTLSMDNGALKASDVRIENWPLKDQPCKQCEVTLKRRHHPNGPDIWVKFVDTDKNTKTWVASSYQSQFIIDDWKVRFNDHVLTLTEEETGIESKVDGNSFNQQKLNSKNQCMVLWGYRRALKQPAQHISPDVAAFKSQVIIQCKS